MRLLISALILLSSAVSDVMRLLISVSILPDNSVSFVFSVPISDFAVDISACNPSISDSAAAIRPERSFTVASVVPALFFKSVIAVSCAVIFVVLAAILPSRSVFAVFNASEVANLPSASVFVYISAALAFKASFASAVSVSIFFAIAAALLAILAVFVAIFCP